MDAMTSQITSLGIVYSIVYSGAYQRKHQGSVSLAFMREIHRWSVISLHKGPVMWKMFPFDDIIMYTETVFDERFLSYNLMLVFLYSIQFYFVVYYLTFCDSWVSSDPQVSIKLLLIPLYNISIFFFLRTHLIKFSREFHLSQVYTVVIWFHQISFLLKESNIQMG